MRSLSSYIRVIFFSIASAVFLMYLVFPNSPMKAFGFAWFWGVLVFLFFLAIALEICVAALQRVMYLTLNEEARMQYDAQIIQDKKERFKWIKSCYNKLLGSKPLEEEHEIILDHNYDGIRELDNRLPPWWLYGFYATMIFAVVYLVRFQVFGDYTQAEEYETQVALAKAEIEAWKKTAKDLVDVNTVTLLTDASDLKVGKTIYEERCVACHKADGGGGIGPNLTDEYWILGGGIKNVFRTISEGGRSGKGMVSWKAEYKPSQIAQIASYVMSLQGSTPAEPKAPEGDMWKAPNAVDPQGKAPEEERSEASNKTMASLIAWEKEN